MRTAKRFGRRLLAFVLAGALSFAVLSAFEAQAAHITDISKLGTITHYNGLIFDYFQSYGGDIEGALAVGGTSKIGTSGQYDLGASAHYAVMGTYPNPDDYPTLLLGGSTTVGRTSGQNYINIYGGPLVRSDSAGYSGATMYTPRGSHTATAGIVGQFFDERYEQVRRALNVVSNANTKPQSQISLSAFNGWSTNYRTTFSAANLQNNFQPDNLTAYNDRVLVINVMNDGLQQINAAHITSAMGNYDLIIFHFPNADSVIYSGSSVLVDGGQINTSASIGSAGNPLLKNYAQRIVWCFPEARTVQIAGAGVVGSVIAPGALVEATGGSVNGMLIAQSFITQGGNELHGFKLGDIFFQLSTGDDDLEGEVILYKYEEGSTFQEYTLLPGAEFELYEGEPPAAFPFTATLVGTYTTNATGIIRVPDLPEGKYFFYETKEPPGYTLPEQEADRVHAFTIDAAHGVEAPLDLYVPNERLTATVLVNKVYYQADGVTHYTPDPNTDTDVKPHFELYYVSGRMNQLVDDECRPDASGEIRMENLVSGRYRLIEADPPDDFWPAYDYIEFVLEIDKDGSYTVEYYASVSGVVTSLGPTVHYSAGGVPANPLDVPEFKNNEISIDTTVYHFMLITKVDMIDTDFPLAGAVFELEKYDAATTSWVPCDPVDADNQPISPIVTDEFGHAYGWLEEGTYRAKEVVFPVGYDDHAYDGEYLYFHVPWGGLLPGNPYPAAAPLVLPFDPPAGGELSVEVFPPADTAQDDGATEELPDDAPGGIPGGDSSAQPDSMPEAALPEAGAAEPENDPAAGPASADDGLFRHGDGEDGDYPEQVRFHTVAMRSAVEIQFTNPDLDALPEDDGDDPAEPPADADVDPEPDDASAGGEPDTSVPPPTGGGDHGDAPEADSGEEGGGEDALDGAPDEPGALPAAAPSGPPLMRPVNGPVTRDIDPNTISVIVRNRASGRIEVTKQNYDNENVAGATFALYYNPETNPAPGDTPADFSWERVATAVSGPGGTAVFEHLKPGLYMVLEIIAPDGYEEILTPEVVKTLSNDEWVLIGATSAVLPSGDTFAFLAVNPYATGGITLWKVDGDSEDPLQNPLAGASFNLYAFDEDTYEWVYYSSYTSGSDGRLAVYPLPYGRYKIAEMNPPSGYEVDTRYNLHEIIFTVSANTNNGYVAVVENYHRSTTSGGGGGGNGGSNRPTPDPNWPLDPPGEDSFIDLTSSSAMVTSSNDNPSTGGTLHARLLLSGLVAVAAAMLMNTLSIHDDDE